MQAVTRLIWLVLAGCGTSGPAAGDASAPHDAAELEASGLDAGVDAPVPRWSLDTSSVTVSGISSGGFMAVQFHVAFSSLVKGAAIFAGGPYMCSKGSVATALTTCAGGSPAPDVSASVAATNANAAAGDIDPTSGLQDARIFLFVGADDDVVNPVVVDALQSYYAALLPSASIAYVNRRAGTAHTWPTLDYGVPCDIVSSPYVGKCSYDGAGAALAQLYGTLAPASASLGGQIVAVPQGAFIADPAAHSLDDTAYAYVPAACASGDACKLHIAFHGCLQGASSVGDAFYAHAGLDEWADANHLVVLYPQAIKSGANPEGCWDFWGYDSPDFAKKSGPQMAMVRAMIDGIAK
ncbi:MAG TPA: hypothetical protein VGH28_34240 [Polyangiaceae bacterium]